MGLHTALFRYIRRCLPGPKTNIPGFVALICLLAVTSWLRNQATAASNDPKTKSVIKDDTGAKEGAKPPQVYVQVFQEKEVKGSRETDEVMQKAATQQVTKYRQIYNSFEYTGKGYQRAEFLNNICANDSRFSSQKFERGRVRVSYDASHNALFCPLCKMASTFWTRVFVMLTQNKGMSVDQLVKTPFDIPISQAPASRQYLSLSTWKVGTQDVRDSFRFLFIRNPYAMLFSAYVDKIVGPNPNFWDVFGSTPSRKSNACGSDLSFAEFLQNIISVNRNHKALDCHVAKYSVCSPCSTRYTYVAKMETFKEDTFHILEKLGQNQTLQIFKSNFTSNHADDAIDDSISGPFSWKSEITRCMSWPEALRRVWRKLQIRGAIGTAKFPLTDEEASKVSQSEFKTIVLKFGRKSTSQERSELKRLSFIEAYQSIPVSMLHDIRKIYWQEFALFDYNSTPDDLFKRENSSLKVYGFLNYSNINEDIKIDR